MSNIMQNLHEIGLNPFAVTLLAESMLKSAYVKNCGAKPLSFKFPIERSDCAGWLGVRITIEAVSVEAIETTPTPADSSIKKVTVEPGGELHFSLIGAKYNLNFLTGKDRVDMLAFGRDVWDAALAAQADAPTEQITSLDVTRALFETDDMIARYSGDDRGNFEPVNVLRRAFSAATRSDNQALREALESAKSFLRFYQDACPKLTTDAEGELMQLIDDALAAPAPTLNEQLDALIYRARGAYQVITVDLIPLEPFAMGSYSMCGSIRPERES
jgi:hypothetical protein